MSNRIARYLAQRFGGTIPTNGNETANPAGPMLTDRGLRTVAAYLEKGRRQAIDNAPVQVMIQSEGWKIIEAELVEDIKKLWGSAMAKILSPDPKLREEAIIESLIARVYNEGVLGRINRRMLDTMLVKEMIQNMEFMQREHETLTKDEG